MTTTERNRVEELTALGFKLAILRGPTGEVDKNGKDSWPHIAYRVSLTLNGKEILATDYKLGIGHVKPVKLFTSNLTTDERSMLETWQRKPYANFINKQLQADVAAKLARQQKVVPELDDVLHSLLLEGETFFNAQSFEDWAGDFGYDADSRKAEGIYRACDSIGRQLAAGIPKAILEKAREIVQDL